jgi:hypothetical protein
MCAREIGAGGAGIHTCCGSSGVPRVVLIPGVYLPCTWALFRRSWISLRRPLRLPSRGERQLSRPALGREGRPAGGHHGAWVGLSGESPAVVARGVGEDAAGPAGTARQGPGRRGNVTGRLAGDAAPADAALVRCRHASRWPSPWRCRRRPEVAGFPSGTAGPAGGRPGCGRPGTRSRANLVGIA